MLRAAVAASVTGIASMLSDMAQRDDPLAPKSPCSRHGPSGSFSCSCTAGPLPSTRSTKPYLDANDASPCPSNSAHLRSQNRRPDEVAVEFKNCGKAGCPSATCCEIREHADDLCVVRSMVGEGVDHGAALLQTFTGPSLHRPSMGSWVLYGLGSQNRNLPGYITIKRRCRMAARKTGRRISAGIGAGTAIGNAGMQVSEIQRTHRVSGQPGSHARASSYELD